MLAFALEHTRSYTCSSLCSEWMSSLLSHSCCCRRQTSCWSLKRNINKHSEVKWRKQVRIYMLTNAPTCWFSPDCPVAPASVCVSAGPAPDCESEGVSAPPSTARPPAPPASDGPARWTRPPAAAQPPHTCLRDEESPHQLTHMNRKQRRRLQLDFRCCTCAGLQARLETQVFLLQDSDLVGQLSDRIQALNVDVCRCPWKKHKRFDVIS